VSDPAEARRALLEALLVERFTHLPQHPQRPAVAAPRPAEALRLVVDNRRHTA
jgi:hypothetical protein